MYLFEYSLSSFFFECYGHHLDLHVLTHSFPTRRSADLGPHSWFHMARCPPGRGTGTRLRWRRSLRAGAWYWKTLTSHDLRSEEHTSELQSLMRISSAVICLKKKKHNIVITHHLTQATHDSILCHHILVQKPTPTY